MTYLHIQTNKLNDIYTKENATASFSLSTTETVKWLASQELPDVITVGIDCRVPEKAKQRHYNAMMKRVTDYARVSGKSVISIENATFVAVDGNTYEKPEQHTITLG